MNYQKSIITLFLFLTGFSSVFAAGLEDRVITLSSNERFDLVQANSVNFKFQPLSDEARKLEITNDASSLGVAYLGQIKLKENITPLSALRSVADQIGESLDINFGVIADSNTSEALKSNELLLLYHPSVTITLALAKPTENSDYEIICTYALKSIVQEQDTAETTTTPEATEPTQGNAAKQISTSSNTDSDIAPVEDIPEDAAENVNE